MTLIDKNLYYVGGYVRDCILNANSLDIDYTYQGNAIEFAQKYKVIRENPAFGTVRIFCESLHKDIDIASTRKEIYPKAGHLPIVTEIGCSVEEDLIRRDFSINAIAKNTLTNKLIDPFEGVNDVKNKTIRILHKNSFVDDPTRIIRALKFSTRFGFQLDDETYDLQTKYLENINYDMCYHRLKKELKETFNLNKQAAYSRFINQKLYKLLGKNQNIPNIKLNIEEIIKQYKIENAWIIYLGFFDLSNFELTRTEKRILEWFDRLKSEKATNNTPIESIIMYKIYSGKL